MKQPAMRRFADLARTLALALVFALALAGCVPPDSSSALPPDWDEEGLHAALEQCVSFGPGEAGVSLKIVIASCGMLDWAEDNPTTPADDVVTRSVEDWLGEKELETRELFWENWPSIDRQAREILADPEGSADLLGSAGNPQKHSSYTLAYFDRLCGCVTACEDC